MHSIFIKPDLQLVLTSDPDPVSSPTLKGDEDTCLRKVPQGSLQHGGPTLLGSTSSRSSECTGASRVSGCAQTNSFSGKNPSM